jgi:hypothetical protein
VHLHARATDGVFVPTGDGPPAFLSARPIAQADLAALTEKVRRRVVRWFRMQRRSRRPGNLSSVARRAARDRHPQPLTGSHATVRTARK